MKSDSAAPYLLLRQAIRRDEDLGVQEAIRLARQAVIDWPDLFVLSQNHEILPQVYKLLKRMPAEVVPAMVLEQFQAAHRQVAVEQMAMVAAFLQVRQHLEQEGIMAIPFKGFWLAHSAYAQIADRECADIDLFIQKSDFRGMCRVMTALGYLPPENLRKLPEAAVFRRHGDFSFDKTADGKRLFHFEFHWNLGNFKYSMDIGMPELISQVEKQSFQGNQMAVFSPSANLLLAALHHGGKDAWLKLKQVLDIAGLLTFHGPELDWHWILSEARRLGAEAVVLSGLGLAAVLCGLSLPADLEKSVAAPKIQRLVADRMHYLEKPTAYWESGYYLNRLVFHLRSRDHFLDKWRMGWAFLLGVFQQKIDQWKVPKG